MAEQDKRTINKDINNKNKKSMPQTTRQQRGRPWQWLQVMTLMLVMLAGAPTTLLAQEYITDVMVLGCGTNGLDAKNLRNEYTNKGWTVVEQDLNQGNGGWFIYIAYKTSSTANQETGYITDICASDKNVSSFTSDGRTYYRAPTNSDFNGDLNRGSNGSDIYIYYTCDRKNLSDYGGSKRVMTRLSTTTNTNGNTDDGDAPRSGRQQCPNLDPHARSAETEG